MRHDTTLDDLLKDPEYRRLFQQEKLILEVTESICDAMEKTATPRSVLARLLGRTKGCISQLLSGRRNLTLRTWADMMTVLGHEAQISYRPLRCEVAYQFTPDMEAEVAGTWSIPAATTVVNHRSASSQSDETLAA